MIEEAIDDYIALNYNKKIKPLMNMRGVNGKSKYTSTSAVAELKKCYIKVMLDNFICNNNTIQKPLFNSICKTFATS